MTFEDKTLIELREIAAAAVNEYANRHADDLPLTGMALITVGSDGDTSLRASCTGTQMAMGVALIISDIPEDLIPEFLGMALAYAEQREAANE